MPSHRAAGRSLATTGSVVSVAAAPAGTSSPSPITNEKAPEIGWESAETTR